jgi:hypothetical protein
MLSVIPEGLAMLKFFAAASFAAAMIAAPAAAVLVYDTPASTPGNQSWAGTLGLNFTVNRTITFNTLGTFDSGKDGITSDIGVAVFDANTQLIVSPIAFFLNAPNPTGAAYVTQRVANFTLTPGNYQLAAVGYNDIDRNYNAGFDFLPGAITFNSFGGALTATGTAYNANFFGGFATITDVGNTRYGAGTMGYVPEPATWAMLIGGFAMVGFAMRRRTAATAA